MPDGDPKVAKFPLSRERATEIIRDIAKHSERWSIHVQYNQKQDWRRLVNRRQVDLCLREGYVLDEVSTLDEYGNYKFRIARVCAGVNVVIHAVLQSSPPLLPKIFVVAIEGDHIPNPSEDSI